MTTKTSSVTSASSTGDGRGDPAGSGAYVVSGVSYRVGLGPGAPDVTGSADRKAATKEEMSGCRASGDGSSDRSRTSSTSGGSEGTIRDGAVGSHLADETPDGEGEAGQQEEQHRQPGGGLALGFADHGVLSVKVIAG